MSGPPLHHARSAIVAVFAALVIFVTVADVGGRLFVDPSFHISDVMLGTLVGALLLALGIDVSRRWRE